MYGHTYSKSVDQPGKVVNPARGQLNRENKYLPRSRWRLRIWSRETSLAVLSRVSLLISIPRINLVLTYWFPPEFRGGVSLFIKNCPAPSGQSQIDRVTQLRTDGVHGRESAGTGAVNLKVVSERVLPWQVTMDQLICASLSHTRYWYGVGIRKVPTSYTYCFEK